MSKILTGEQIATMWESHAEGVENCLTLECENGHEIGGLFDYQGRTYWYHQPYVLPDEINAATSSEEGRRTNTTDGWNHWKAGGADLERHAGLPNILRLSMTCECRYDIPASSDRLISLAKEASTVGYSAVRLEGGTLLS